MLITASEASVILRQELGLASEQVRHLLRCGLVGPCLSVGRTRMYQEETVRELAARPFVDDEELGAACPRGVYVARLARDRAYDTTRPWRELAVELAVQPALPPLTAAVIGVWISVHGSWPWVATVSGLVILAAEAVGGRVASDGSTVFRLEPPGAWRELVEGRWFPTGRGRPWVLWHPCATATMPT